MGTAAAKTRERARGKLKIGDDWNAITIIALSQSNPLKAIAELVRQIRRERIKTLFIENISDARLVEELARETGAAPGPPLYSDALSGPNGPAPTYIRMIEYNTAALKDGMLQN